MNSYRLIDEIPGVQKRRPPFSPLGIFLVNWLFLPFAVPLWVINWGRLGQPEKRLLSAALAALAFGAQLYLIFETDPKTADDYIFLPAFVYGYFQLNTQRPLYRAHIMRGGAKAPAWPVWLAGALSLALLAAFGFRFQF